MSFIEVKNISKDFKVNKRSAGIPGMIANMFAPKFEIKKAVKTTGLLFEKALYDKEVLTPAEEKQFILAIEEVVKCE